MRLKESDVLALGDVVASALEGAAARLLLYGSRTDDAKRGGDIDLILVCADEAAPRLKKMKGKLLVEFAKKIGERRVDFMVVSETDAGIDPFVQSVLPQALLLKEWDA